MNKELDTSSPNNDLEDTPVNATHKLLFFSSRSNLERLRILSRTDALSLLSEGLSEDLVTAFANMRDDEVEGFVKKWYIKIYSLLGKI